MSKLLKVSDLEPLPDYGELYTLEDFRTSVASGALTDDDGSGEWATSTHYRNSGLRYADVFNDTAPDWATHVLWFSK